MKYKNKKDDQYRTLFKQMPRTLDLIDRFSVAEFITYLETNENTELEDVDREYIDGYIMQISYYAVYEPMTTIYEEFYVTQTGRVFHCITTGMSVELMDKDELKKTIAIEG